MQLTTYVNYAGNCEDAFKYYKQHLGGKIVFLQRHGTQPQPGQVATEWNGKVLHARLELGGTPCWARTCRTRSRCAAPT